MRSKRCCCPRRKLGDDAKSPRYILTQPRVGSRMPRVEHRNRWSLGRTKRPARATEAVAFGVTEWSGLFRGIAQVFPDC